MNIIPNNIKKNLALIKESQKEYQKTVINKCIKFLSLFISNKNECLSLIIHSDGSGAIIVSNDLTGELLSGHEWSNIEDAADAIIDLSSHTGN